MRLTLLALAPFVPIACTFDGLDGYTSGIDGAAMPPDAAIEAASDTGPNDSAPIDTGNDVVAPPCNLTAPFGTPVAVTSLNTAVIDSQAALSPDELTVYFTSNRLNTGSNVFTASRASVMDAFGSVAPLASLNFSADTWNVTLTGDGLTAYLVTDQLSTDHMYKATRASSLVGFGTPTLMPSAIVKGEQPFVTPNGTALYYSDATLGPKSEIVRAALGGTPTTAVQTLNAGGLDVGIPVVDPTETTIYFAAFTAGTFASYDIWTATRATSADAWPVPTKVSELDTANFETPSWLSADDCELYFTRAPNASNWDIYVARRP